MKIGEELHRRFKIACVHQGKEMSKVVRKAIEGFVWQFEKKAKK